ncbi:hypothetical protein MTR67_040000 [Solanum verrucosum]|uniref:Uncharacterized protein n=1 Tax=Solanum verrucosum TaxID=315347 RepID=A0AAF0UHU5_SOLVR|nr:hypothetical protein MTR67_040000 [Solanum verrucosum]
MSRRCLHHHHALWNEVDRKEKKKEYRIVACVVDETTWVKNLLKELHVHIPTPPTMFCDRLRVTYLCENNNLHNRMKHIVVDFHYVRQQVSNKHLIFEHITSLGKLADTLTKPLPKSPFLLHFSNLGVVAHHLS